MDPVKAVESFRQKYCSSRENCFLGGDQLKEARTEFRSFPAQIKYLILRDLERSGYGLYVAGNIGRDPKSVLLGKANPGSMEDILTRLRSVVKNKRLPIWEKRSVVRLGLILLKAYHSVERDPGSTEGIPTRKKIRKALIEIYRLSKKSRRGSPIFDTDDDLVFDDKDKTPIPYLYFNEVWGNSEMEKETVKNWSKFSALIEDDSKWKAFLKRIPEGSRWVNYGLARSWSFGHKEYEVIKKNGKIIICLRVFLDAESESAEKKIESIKKRNIESVFNKRMPEKGVKVNILFVDEPYSADVIVNLGHLSRGRSLRWDSRWNSFTFAHEVGHLLVWPDRYHEFYGGGDQTYRPGLYFFVAQNELMANSYLPGRLIRKHDVRFSIASAFNWVGYYHNMRGSLLKELYKDVVELWGKGKEASRIIGIGNPKDFEGCVKRANEKLHVLGLSFLNAKRIYSRYNLYARSLRGIQKPSKYLSIRKKQYTEQLISVCERILKVYPGSEAARFYLMKVDRKNALKHFLLLAATSLKAYTSWGDFTKLAETNRQKELYGHIIKYLNQRIRGDIVIQDIKLSVPDDLSLGGPYWVKAQFKVFSPLLGLTWYITIKLTNSEICSIFRKRSRIITKDPRFKKKSDWGLYDVSYSIKKKLLSSPRHFTQ